MSKRECDIHTVCEYPGVCIRRRRAREAINAHVLLKIEDRTLLGTIKNVQLVNDNWILIVHHFNGEAWPVTPTLDEVTFICA